jgi:phage shock protein A
MPIFEKISRILKSNINDLLDRVEDPEKVLNQLLEDMRHEFKEAKVQVVAAIRDGNRLEAQYKENLESAENWEKRAILFIENGDDVRAKEALRRKKSASELAENYREQLEAQRESITVLKDGLSTLQAKIEEAEHKRALLIARQKRAEAERNVQQTVAGLAESSAADALHRIQDRVAETEAHAEAYRELQNLDTDDSVFERNPNDDIEDELAKLKAKLKK